MGYMTETPQTPPPPENVPQPPIEPAVPFAVGTPAGAGNPYAAEYTAAIPVQPWGAQPAAEAIQGANQGQPAPVQPTQPVQQWPAQQVDPAQQWQQTGQVPPLPPVQPGQPVQPGTPPQAWSQQPAQPPFDPVAQPAQPVFDPATGQWQQAPGQPGVGFQYPPQPAVPAQPSAAATFFKESEAFSGFREVGKNKFGSERFWSSILRIIGWVMLIVNIVSGILIMNLFADLFGLIGALGSIGGSAAAPSPAWGQAIFYMLSTWAGGALIWTGCMVAANFADDAEASRALQSQTNTLLERIAANTDKPAPEDTEAEGEELPSSSLL
jgi:hypothetical protein